MNSYSCCTLTDRKSYQVEKLSRILRVVSEDSRLKLLCILRRGRHCVCEFINHTKLSQSLVSHHLKDLKEAKIVKDKKKGLKVYYQLTEKGKRITDLLFQID